MSKEGFIMAYCAQDDILLKVDEDTLIRLTDDEDAGAVDADIVERAIADADEEIDSYLAARYALPFETVPNLVRRISVAIAICNLYGRRDVELPEGRKDEGDWARKTLDRLAKGAMTLDAPDPAADSSAGIGVTTSKSDRVFSRGRSSDNSSGTLDNY
jgi:phage gp36-like protein